MPFGGALFVAWDTERPHVFENIWTALNVRDNVVSFPPIPAGIRRPAILYYFLMPFFSRLNPSACVAIAYFKSAIISLTVKRLTHAADPESLVVCVHSRNLVGIGRKSPLQSFRVNPTNTTDTMISLPQSVSDDLGTSTFKTLS